MTDTNKAGAVTALRALEIEIRRCAGNNNARFHHTWADQVRNIAKTLAASPPEDAPAVDGGDAGLATYNAVLDLIRDAYRAGVAGTGYTEQVTALYDLMLAAAPAPAVEREAVPIAEIEGIDEYGPRLGWYRHWAALGVGTKLYTTPPAEAREPVGVGVDVTPEGTHVAVRLGQKLVYAQWHPQATPREPARDEATPQEPAGASGRDAEEHRDALIVMRAGKPLLTPREIAALDFAIAALHPAAASDVQGREDVVAWLHTIQQGGGEHYQALSFAPDNFPLGDELGFRSLGVVPLFTQPPTDAEPFGWYLAEDWNGWRKGYTFRTRPTGNGTNTAPFVPVYAVAGEASVVADEMEAWSEKRLSGPHDNRNVRRLLNGWAERLRTPHPQGTRNAAEGAVGIPANVYYDVIQDNFYSAASHASMGVTFWQTWRNRRNDFPGSVKAARNPHTDKGSEG